MLIVQKFGGSSVADNERIFKVARRITERYKEGNDINLIDVIKDKDVDLFDDLDLKNNISLLEKYLKLLNKREKEIIIKRYGLNNTKDMTQKEIADNLKISRSYVSRIEKNALHKLRTLFPNTL